MKIKKLELINFRNYSNLFLEFTKKINIFIGHNAQGKTNILEGIYLLGITKSYRTINEENLIKNNEKRLRVRGLVETDKNINLQEFELIISQKGKKVSINRNTMKKMSDYISKLNVIVFSPDDLELIKGAPSIRRKFLNIEIGQLYNEFLMVLNDYNFLLKNRNEYLKKVYIDKYDINYLLVIDNQLVDKALEIYKYRSMFLENLNFYVKKIYKNIFKDKEIDIRYLTSFNIDGDDFIKLKDKYLKKLQKNLERDIILGQTTVGPHRDDFVVTINNQNAKEFASQGQQRVVTLCLKLAEIEIFKKIKKESPIVLLDDIFSELDKIKKNNVIKYIDKDMQVFITTTDLDNIDKKLLKDATIFKVKNASVKKRRGVTNERK